MSERERHFPNAINCLSLQTVTKELLWDWDQFAAICICWFFFSTGHLVQKWHGIVCLFIETLWIYEAINAATLYGWHTRHAFNVKFVYFPLRKCHVQLIKQWAHELRLELVAINAHFILHVRIKQMIEIRRFPINFMDFLPGTENPPIWYGRFNESILEFTKPHGFSPNNIDPELPIHLGRTNRLHVSHLFNKIENWRTENFPHICVSVLNKTQNTEWPMCFVVLFFGFKFQSKREIHNLKLRSER